jgi:hypothetical protein
MSLGIGAWPIPNPQSPFKNFNIIKLIPVYILL